jgi:uncharacterized protein
MSFVSRLVGRLWKLPTPVTRDIAVEPLRIPVRDGVELVADRYYSRKAAAQPTVLIRSCYGRTGFNLFARLFAERGIQVVLQSCRGTAGSQGVFRPFFDEQNDGEDTVEWIASQPWFNGDLALWGGSYLGNAAWAIANSEAGRKVKALGLHVTLTNFRDRTYAFDGFTMDGCIGWTATMVNIISTGSMNILAAMLGARKMRALTQRAIAVTPMRDADRVFKPDGVSWWQDWMDHAEPGDPWWDALDYGKAAQAIPATVMTAGWYDIFLPWQLKDFMNAQRADRDIRIIIGPWMHAASQGFSESLRRSMALFQEQFGIGSASQLNSTNARVRLFLMGANEWREYPSWPPPGSANRTYYLHKGGGLSFSVQSGEAVSAFTYDPAQATPSFYGATLEGRSGSGDMAELERRSDVLLFTTEPLSENVDAVGPVSGEIYLRSNTEHTDVYLCLCDVTPNSRSTNVCDGYTRLRPDPAAHGERAADGRRMRKVNVEFWPTAYRFRKGHRIRVIVASGAHPRYSYNPGSGEPLGDAKTMVVAHQDILHGSAYPSAITMTVTDG